METTRPAGSRVIGLVEGIVGRAHAEFAQALNLLFDDLLRRVPAGAFYVLDRVRGGEKVVHDHGAVRTVLGEAGALPAETARRILPDLAGAFDRAHPVPALADYERLLEESAEAAWIATEGNAFNHVTDRVEVSASGRVIPTAYRAARVERPFVGPEGALAQAIFKMTAPVIA